MRHSRFPVMNLLALSIPILFSTASAASPPFRVHHTGVLDSANHRMIVFGGVDGSTAYNDVWSLDLVNRAWTQLLPAPGPPPLRDHSAVYDPVRQRMLVFGGSAFLDSYSHDVWSLSLSGTPAWTLIATAGTPPPGRFSHVALYDPLRDRMLVFDGYNGAFMDDLWQLDLATSTWSQINAAGTRPPARGCHDCNL